ncbi:YcjX family protein [Arsukibacterium sp. UBA3155]|uniref:YcjX family protein n=1 Tax=Arsukibacterium sp. UBA3155 TaxID=1946058 RepID=UPI0025BE973E|nr:YcjX family protein [Arsukibacterium sp. UBA3155]|tara:strand:+ start:19681 stop:21066 length:1386 start_codon:yes stop_codon:yes gene_type:complete
MTWLDKLQHQSRQLRHRALDRHVRLGVTGLSGAGKTAFITSLVHQLTQGDSPQNLPFFSVVQQGRYLGGRLAAEQALTIPRFPFEHNMSFLQQDPPQWPPSTTGWSQLSLALRYKAGQGLRSHLQTYSELELDIVDYPGEWLLDLPLLQLNYQQWCEFSWQLFAKPHRQALAADFKALLTATDLNDASEQQLHRVTDAYKALLQQFSSAAGTYLNQPGRLLVPGELAGAPMLQLIPLLPEQLNENSALLKKLTDHYQSYRDYVVKPFYKQHFSQLDRQVVLVDCLSALNAGAAATAELSQALQLIMQSFQYGPSSMLRRLFKPQISKVLFAASKADHVTPEQHQALTLLLQNLLRQPLKQTTYQLAKTEAMALAAVSASKSGYVEQQGQRQPCLTGTDSGTAKKISLFPGDVPSEVPDEHVFSRHQFSFPSLLPLPFAANANVPHIRMDHALQFLLGDKLR